MSPSDVPTEDATPSSSSQIRRRDRQLTTLLDLHKKDLGAPKLKVDYNDIGLAQPIGDTKSTWQNFLGTNARNEIYF